MVQLPIDSLLAPDGKSRPSSFTLKYDNNPSLHCRQIFTQKLEIVMAAIRSSNSDRTMYRTKCRQKLSEHICNVWISFRSNIECWNGLEVAKLGILIAPADVRLITSADDPYTWHPLPEKEHLFRKHLSKHSIGAYRELCRGVGVSFEAVPVSVSDAIESKVIEERRGAKVYVILNSCLIMTNERKENFCRWNQLHRRDRTIKGWEPQINGWTRRVKYPGNRGNRT